MYFLPQISFQDHKFWVISGELEILTNGYDGQTKFELLQKIWFT